MTTCRSVEQLLYLFRSGELTEEERQRVLDHTATCARCGGILRHLRAIDREMDDLRNTLPGPGDERATVDSTMRRISPAGGTRRGGDVWDGFIDWLAPALKGVTAIAALLLIVQLSRDAMRTSELERRLTERSGAVPSVQSFSQAELHRMYDQLAGAGERGETFLTHPHNASIAGDPTSIISPGMLSAFRRQPALFEAFSRKYPHLAAITSDNGINESERKILETEGRAFLRDFQQLLNEGGR